MTPQLASVEEYGERDRVYFATGQPPAPGSYVMIILPGVAHWAVEGVTVTGAREHAAGGAPMVWLAVTNTLTVLLGQLMVTKLEAEAFGFSLQLK